MIQHIIDFYNHHHFDYIEEFNGNWKQINQKVCAGSGYKDGEYYSWYCPYIPEKLLVDGT